MSGYNLPALLPENGFNVAHALVRVQSLPEGRGYLLVEFGANW